jgi:hypothetical protein
MPALVAGISLRKAPQCRCDRDNHSVAIRNDGRYRRGGLHPTTFGMPPLASPRLTI